MATFGKWTKEARTQEAAELRRRVAPPICYCRTCGAEPPVAMYDAATCALCAREEADRELGAGQELEPSARNPAGPSSADPYLSDGRRRS